MIPYDQWAKFGPWTSWDDIVIGKVAPIDSLNSCLITNAIRGHTIQIHSFPPSIKCEPRRNKQFSEIQSSSCRLAYRSSATSYGALENDDTMVLVVLVGWGGILKYICEDTP